MRKQRITGTSKAEHEEAQPTTGHWARRGSDSGAGGAHREKGGLQARSSAHGGRRAASLAVELRASEEPHSRGGLEHDWFHEKSDPQCFRKAAWKHGRGSDSGSTSAGFKCRLCSCEMWGLEHLLCWFVVRVNETAVTSSEPYLVHSRYSMNGGDISRPVLRPLASWWSAI